MAPERNSKRGSRGNSSSSRSPDSGRPRYSKWIESPDDHAERNGQTLATQNHDVIRHWAEERGAKPVTIEGQQDDPRVLRFDFPGYGGKNLVEVSWDDWFKSFDDRNVVMLFQEHLRNGNQSNFFKFDQMESEKPGGNRKRRAA